MANYIYSPLSPPSSRLNTNSTPALIQCQHKRPLHRIKWERRQFILRIIVFLLLESAFILLASFAAIQHIPLPAPPSTSRLTEIKTAVTALSIVWHMVATWAVKDILVQLFSSEWKEQIRKSGKITPGETDIVSRLSTGYIDQLKHFLSPSATAIFRLGLICDLLILGIKSLGSSAIIVDTIVVPRHAQIGVATLSLRWSLYSSPLSSVTMGIEIENSELAMDNANIAIQLEYFGNTTYGFQLESQANVNVLIPWPSPEYLSPNRSVQYKTDIITYDFSCNWEKPMGVKVAGPAEEQWMYWLWTTPRLNHSQFVLNPGPSIRGPGSKNVTFHSEAILPLHYLEATLEASNPHSAFLFVGGPDGNLRMNDSMPIAPVQCGLSEPQTCNATVLICDPQLLIRPAIVMAAQGTLSLHHILGGNPVGNIPKEPANALFAQSLGVAIASQEYMLGLGQGLTSINELARSLFLEPTVDLALLKPLPLKRINKNMNAVLRTSSKPYLSGYYGGRGTTSDPAVYRSDLKEGTEDFHVLVLSTSMSILAVVICLVVTCIALLMVIVTITHRYDLRTFDLENIIEILKGV